MAKHSVVRWLYPFVEPLPEYFDLVKLIRMASML
jgi:hypothetical protein